MRLFTFFFLCSMAHSAFAVPEECIDAVAKTAPTRSRKQYSLRNWMIGNVVLGTLISSMGATEALREQTVGAANQAYRVENEKVENLVKDLGEEKVFYILAARLTQSSFGSGSDGQMRSSVGAYLRQYIKENPEGEVTRQLNERGIPLDHEGLSTYLGFTRSWHHGVTGDLTEPFNFQRYLSRREISTIAARALAKDWTIYKATSGNTEATVETFLRTIEEKFSPE